jgi:hypothetical protein
MSDDPRNDTRTPDARQPPAEDTPPGGTFFLLDDPTPAPTTAPASYLGPPMARLFKEHLAATFPTYVRALHEAAWRREVAYLEHRVRHELEALARFARLRGHAAQARGGDAACVELAELRAGLDTFITGGRQ